MIDNDKEYSIMDKNKPILVYYVGCKGRDFNFFNQNGASIDSYLKRIFDNSIKWIIVPNFESKEYRVELLNPKNMTKEQEELIINLCNKIEKIKMEDMK